MTKNRIFLIHGWGGSPNNDWLPWAKTELENTGYEVIAPTMPDTDTPVIDAWVNYLTELVGEIKPDDTFVGHSIGYQTVLRYLEKSKGKAGKVILVAPWITLSNLESKEMWAIAEPWLKTPINFDDIKAKANFFITIFSDNDPWVPYQENLQTFKEKLNPNIVTLHNRGHITAEEGSVELPELLPLLQ